MKKVYFVLIVLSVLVSCTKEEEGPSHYIQYNDEKYELAKGYLIFFGGEHNNYDIALTSSQVNVNEQGRTGIGNSAYFQLFSSSQTELTSGIYTYSSSLTPFTFNRGNYGLNYDYANRNGTSLTLVGGSLDVTKAGNVYTITFSSVLASGAQVTGTYSGPLTALDFSDILSDVQ